MLDPCILCINSPVSDLFVIPHTSLTYNKVVTGEGMPMAHDPSKRGDLIITFDVKFPEKLSAEGKHLIKQALPCK